MAKWITFINVQAARFVALVNNLNKHQLALLSTFFSLGFLCLILLNLHLYPTLSKQEKGITFLVEISPEIPAEKAELPPEKKTENESLASNSFETNQTYNTQAKASFKTSELSKSQASNEQGTGPGNFENKLKELAQRKQRAIDSLEAIEGETNNLPAKTRVYYSLFERNAEHLPIPVYTCKQGGKVVVDIKVNPKGDILDTKINTALSNTSNGCLLENALRYAARSRFNLSNGKMQWGTITYYFQAK